jgi:regulator of cell morphogenesis and NO signaling
MIHTNKTFIKSGMRMSDLIDENPALLLLLEHFGLDPLVHDMTVSELCQFHDLPLDLFICIANLYNKFSPVIALKGSEKEIHTITLFLNNSHRYYKEEKYPEIQRLIKLMNDHNKSPEIRLLGSFFNEYFTEVLEHLEYEDRIVFPYIKALIHKSTTLTLKEYAGTFSVKEYRDHHTDIESKLIELKNLLVKHIPVQNDKILRRKLLASLFELEYDLNIHTRIEDHILVPLVKKLEKQA